jgi:hypothetical protein
MNEERFDFGNLKVYQKALAMDSKLRTPNSLPSPKRFVQAGELKTIFRGKNSFDEILLQLTRVDLFSQSISSRKVLFWGERAGEISSYVAGWLAGKGREVIVLDGANRFDPYMVSSFARKALIPPERLLKKIRIARAFTCYQMAMMVGERLNDLFNQEGATVQPENRWVILLGPVTPFMDEDVSEREVRPLFERSLKKIEEMAMKGVPFLLFQPSVFSNPPFPPFPPFTKGGVGGLKDLKRAYLMKRLFQFSNLVWKISLEGQESKIVLEKELTLTKSLSHSAIGHSTT